MRRIGIVTGITILLLSAANADAGRIFGDIKLDGKPVAEGVAVRVTVPTAGEAAKEGETAKEGAAAKEGEVKAAAKAKPVFADSCQTDKFGSYKLNVKQEGKCSLVVLFEKQPVSIEVFSNKEATRYDLILEKKEGKLSLRRK